MGYEVLLRGVTEEISIEDIRAFAETYGEVLDVCFAPRPLFLPIWQRPVFLRLSRTTGSKNAPYFSRVWFQSLLCVVNKLWNRNPSIRGMKPHFDPICQVTALAQFFDPAERAAHTLSSHR